MSTNASTVDGFESTVATVAFVDLAGFSALTDVYGDSSAIAVLQRFEELVREALGGSGRRSSGSVTKRCLDFLTRQPPFRCSDVCFRLVDPNLRFR